MLIPNTVENLRLRYRMHRLTYHRQKICGVRPAWLNKQKSLMTRKKMKLKVWLGGQIIYYNIIYYVGDMNVTNDKQLVHITH